MISTSGTYYLNVDANDGTTGKYKMHAVVARPGLESEPEGAHQILFVDFDGVTVNMSTLYGSGVKNLSPLRSFLTRWGLDDTPEHEEAVIQAILENLQETLVTDIQAMGNNPDDFQLEIRNSLEHPDEFGSNPYVSRVIIGGSRSEAGIPGFATAQHVDVGNFKFNDDAIVTLDRQSAPAGSPGTLNGLPLDPSRDRDEVMIELIGTIVGRQAAHEAGHNFGNYHTDKDNLTLNVMDQSGLDLLPGDDGLYGTDDDLEIDFGIDVYAAINAAGYEEPFENTGVNDTLNTIAFGLTTGTAQALHTERLPGVVSGQSLTTMMAEPLLSQAISHWQQVGAPVQELEEVHLRVTDLPGTQIGRAYGTSITLDANAAGWGWAIDAHSREGGMDLLSALTHEVGHLLGYDHNDGGHQVMAASLSAGLHVLHASGPEHLQSMGPFVSGALASEDPFATPLTTSVDADRLIVGLKQENSVFVSGMMPVGASKDLRSFSADRAIAMMYREQQSDRSDNVLREDDLLDLVLAELFNE